MKISAGGWRLINASSKNAAEKVRCRFRHILRGRKLILSSPDGHMLDIFESGVLRPDARRGRAIGDDSGERVFFSTPTPGKANSSDILSAYTAKPVFQGREAMPAARLEISITCETPRTDILYIGRFKTDSPQQNIHNFRAYCARQLLCHCFF